MSVEKGEDQPLAPWQKLVAENYGGGDYAHLADMTQGEVSDLCSETGATGDTLLNFLMLELSPLEDCDSWEEAVSRTNSAADQITEMQVLIGDARA